MKRILPVGFWILGVIFIIFLIVSCLVDYPKWLDKILDASFAVLPLTMAYQNNLSNRKNAKFYLIIGILMIVNVFLPNHTLRSTFDILLIIAFVAILMIQLTKAEKEENQNP
jgi:hypothetical protein